MSPLPIPSAVTATLPVANIHPNGHGHKKGTPLDPSPGSTSGTSAPLGSTQNLFSRLLSSLQQLIGARQVPTTPAPTLSANATAETAATAAPKINVMA
jgi:hypothetical protein